MPPRSSLLLMRNVPKSVMTISGKNLVLRKSKKTIFGLLKFAKKVAKEAFAADPEMLSNWKQCYSLKKCRKKDPDSPKKDAWEVGCDRASADAISKGASTAASSVADSITANSQVLSNRASSDPAVQVRRKFINTLQSELNKERLTKLAKTFEMSYGDFVEALAKQVRAADAPSKLPAKGISKQLLIELIRYLVIDLPWKLFFRPEEKIGNSRVEGNREEIAACDIPAEHGLNNKGDKVLALNPLLCKICDKLPEAPVLRQVYSKEGVCVLKRNLEGEERRGEPLFTIHPIVKADLEVMKATFEENGIDFIPDAVANLFPLTFKRAHNFLILMKTKGTSPSEERRILRDFLKVDGNVGSEAPNSKPVEGYEFEPSKTIKWNFPSYITMQANSVFRAGEVDAGEGKCEEGYHGVGFQSLVSIARESVVEAQGQIDKSRAAFKEKEAGLEYPEVLKLTTTYSFGVLFTLDFATGKPKHTCFSPRPGSVVEVSHTTSRISAPAGETKIDSPSPWSFIIHIQIPVLLPTSVTFNIRINAAIKKHAIDNPCLLSAKDSAWGLCDIEFIFQLQGFKKQESGGFETNLVALIATAVTVFGAEIAHKIQGLPSAEISNDASRATKWGKILFSMAKTILPLGLVVFQGLATAGVIPGLILPQFVWTQIIGTLVVTGKPNNKFEFLVKMTGGVIMGFSVPNAGGLFHTTAITFDCGKALNALADKVKSRFVKSKKAFTPQAIDGKLFAFRAADEIYIGKTKGESFLYKDPQEFEKLGHQTEGTEMINYQIIRLTVDKIGKSYKSSTGKFEYEWITRPPRRDITFNENDKEDPISSYESLPQDQMATIEVKDITANKHCWDKDIATTKKCALKFWFEQQDYISKQEDQKRTLVCQLCAMIVKKGFQLQDPDVSCRLWVAGLQGDVTANDKVAAGHQCDEVKWSMRMSIGERAQKSATQQALQAVGGMQSLPLTDFLKQQYKDTPSEEISDANVCAEHFGMCMSADSADNQKNCESLCPNAEIFPPWCKKQQTTKNIPMTHDGTDPCIVGASVKKGETVLNMYQCNQWAENFVRTNKKKTDQLKNCMSSRQCPACKPVISRQNGFLRKTFNKADVEASMEIANKKNGGDIDEIPTDEASEEYGRAQAARDLSTLVDSTGERLDKQKNQLNP